jgi:peptide/nickel transport system substrate-binding protein
VAAPGGTVTEGLVGIAGNLSPLFAEEENARDINSLIYQGLVTDNDLQDVVPVLARSWTLSDDHLTYTFEVRSDVRWADGQPFGAEDVLFTFKVLQDPLYHQAGSEFWKEVKVEAAGPSQVRFTLKAPSASFPLALRLGIIPKHVFDGMPLGSISSDSHSGSKAFGTGPFQVESITSSGKVVTLKRNPEFQPQPYVDHFVFRSYSNLDAAVTAVSKGEVDSVGDLLPPQAAALAKRPEVRLIESKTFTFVAAFFNIGQGTDPYLTQPTVRQALTQAVDRRRLVQEVLGGHAETGSGPIPSSDWAYSMESATQLPYAPDIAKKALDDAGWKLDPGSDIRTRQGTAFSVSLVTPDAYPYRQIADGLVTQLRSIGVEVKVEAVPSSILVGRYLVGRRFQIALAAFDNGPDPDQYSLWHSGAPKDSVNFAGMPRQALIDKDLEDGRALTERKQRKEAYGDFQELMTAAAPAIFLYEPHYIYAVSPRLQGVKVRAVVEPADRFRSAPAWYVRTRAA